MEKQNIGGKILRIFLWMAVIVGGIVIGFVFLIKSCLSKWDSYGVIDWPGVNQANTTMVIVKAYNQTTSYQREGGITQKTYRTTYYLEKIDLETGKVEQKKKLINGRKVKNGPLRCFGGYNDVLWVWVNDIRGYDMSSLEQSIGADEIIKTNPDLDGLLPKEARYYSFHTNLGYADIKALDGDEYRLDLASLEAEILDNENTIQNLPSEFADQLNAITEALGDVPDDTKNSLDELNGQIDKLSKMQEFGPFMSKGISSWASKRDTLNGLGYLLDDKEPKGHKFKLHSFDQTVNEDKKARLFTRRLELENNGTFGWKVTETKPLGKKGYLGGGFLVDFNTGDVYHCSDPLGQIILSKNIIGDEGKLLVTRINDQGEQVWQTNLQMSTDNLGFAGIYGSYLIIAGVIDPNNRPMMGSNALRIVKVDSGELITVKY